MSESKFIEAYDNLMAHLYETMDDTLHSIGDALEIAKDKTSEIGGLTQEEINQISDYLLRDIEHAATENDGNSLSEWFKFDLELVENFALDIFSSLADKTRIELAKIQNQAKKYHSYKSGDIAGPGTFICSQCQKHIAFKSTSRLPECPDCKAKTFSRC